MEFFQGKCYICDSMRKLTLYKEIIIYEKSEKNRHAYRC